MMHLLYTMYFQVSVALTFSLDDVRSMGCTEKNIEFADELLIDFSTGARQVITCQNHKYHQNVLHTRYVSGL